MKRHKNATKSIKLNAEESVLEKKVSIGKKKLTKSTLILGALAATAVTLYTTILVLAQFGIGPMSHLDVQELEEREMVADNTKVEKLDAAEADKPAARTDKPKKPTTTDNKTRMKTSVLEHVRATILNATQKSFEQDNGSSQSALTKVRSYFENDEKSMKDTQSPSPVN